VPITDLISSFSHLAIVPAAAIIEGDTAPPCPLASLPTEILLHILAFVAADDVADFARLSRVCRRFAFIVATEERIWRDVCEHSLVGFGAMHRRWHVSLEQRGGPVVGMDPSSAARFAAVQALRTRALVSSAYSSSWRAMLRARPRVRFNGCYIMTVNYTRSGAPGMAQVWGSPIHIVTYYRYLRFFRDGSLISLLTTRPPAEVVHFLTREALDEHGGGRYHARAATWVSATSHPAKGALRGRWKLGGAAGRGNDSVATQSDPTGDGAESDADPDADPDEANLVIETDGVNDKYLYRMELSLRTAGRRTRNNKLVWRAFRSYNRLTDDWAEFEMRHDQPYLFSRVKSYGWGE
jgi:F-box protein 9